MTARIVISRTTRRLPHSELRLILRRPNCVTNFTSRVDRKRFVGRGGALQQKPTVQLAAPGPQAAQRMPNPGQKPPAPRYIVGAAVKQALTPGAPAIIPPINPITPILPIDQSLGHAVAVPNRAHLATTHKPEAPAKKSLPNGKPALSRWLSVAGGEEGGAGLILPTRPR